ncbi:TonB-dependent receptor plug domain-containing protein [Neolewinella antarctica]|uniref:Iron complex outermembrane receptor protein n=1 Tax=Neolewinella antarctica TaxID=442734 RepID=A0ABX0X7Q6_9BACT|nr:TonB-dependent receptor plug domain-containing protein [Neolewinella antarctica]NJC24903.1 iron complex outermembrane receptor protein [Neolewinella antarctica]
MTRFTTLSLIGFLACFATTLLTAQGRVDTVVTLPAMEVRTTSVRQSDVGAQTVSWTAEALQKLPVTTAGELLEALTGTFVKNYGAGSLATTSVRGGSAGHTLVLWNGLPVHSPMLGLLDLSLLPLEGASSVSFTPGGNSSLWGSGALGGVIGVNNAANFDRRKEVTAGLDIGSFGLVERRIHVGLGNDTWQSDTRLSRLTATNDFPYTPAPTVAELRQSNAAQEHTLLTQNLYWRPGTDQQLSFHFWHQRNARQIPPTNVQTRSAARQDDSADRLVVAYRNEGGRIKWGGKVAAFSESLEYYDEASGLVAPSGFNTLLADATADYVPRRSDHRFMIGTTASRTTARADGYREETPTEQRTALFGGWQYQGSRLSTRLSLRGEIVDGRTIPVIPAFGFSYSLRPDLWVEGKVGRNYRLPTLNDRFWKPGGNPALLAEEGWAEELTVRYARQTDQWDVSAGLTAFYRNTNNWVLWSPNPEFGYWAASNLSRVLSRGLEPRLNIGYRHEALNLQLTAGYDYVRSTNEVAISLPRIEEGEQLIYVPEHQGRVAVTASWRDWQVSYRHRYVGAMMGVNGPIDSYAVGDARIHRAHKLFGLAANLFFNLRNAWNTDYLIIDRRPMPGRHFRAGLTFSFFQPKISP